MQKGAIFGGFRVLVFRRFLGDPGFHHVPLKAPSFPHNPPSPHPPLENPSQGLLGPFSAEIRD
jgi:hypothetical protein